MTNDALFAEVKLDSERIVGNTDEAYAVDMTGQLCPCRSPSSARSFPEPDNGRF